MILRRLFILSIVSIPGTALLQAAPRTLAVDTTASKVTFAVHATVDSFVGKVEKWTLDLTVPDGATIPDTARFSANFAALKTGKNARDREMLHWVNNDTHPKIEFVLARITLVGGDAYTAEGDMSIHGVTKKISIPVNIGSSGDTLTIRGEVAIDHRQFDLPIIRKFALLTVAPEVKVSFNVTGTLR